MGMGVAGSPLDGHSSSKGAGGDREVGAHWIIQKAFTIHKGQKARQ